MKLSTRARYGTRALLDLAINSSSEPVPLKSIAKRQALSLTYLEHLVTPLIAAGFVRSVRGSRGGIALAKPPKEIKLIDVLQVLEGASYPVECIGDPSLCNRSGTCVTRDLWSEVQDAMNQVLENTTLQDLVERHKAKETCGEEMYYI